VDIAEAQRRITAKWQEIEGKDPYTILGVRKGSNDTTIKQAWFALAREYHADAFSGVDLGSAQETLDKVFAAIAEAYDTLTDPEKLAEYEAGAALEASGTSTNVGALLDAEHDFAKGRMLLDRGEYKASARYFAQAAPVNPSNIEWKAHDVFGQWWEKRDKKEAMEASVELEKLWKSAEHVYDILVFAGRLAVEAEEFDRASKLYRRVLREQPKNEIAIREKRLLDRRWEQHQKSQKKGGFLSKLLGKK
jgi:curved DNA-binding protein CbpA